MIEAVRKFYQYWSYALGKRRIEPDNLPFSFPFVVVGIVLIFNIIQIGGGGAGGGGRGRIDFLKFGKKGGDKMFFLEREGIA